MRRVSALDSGKPMVDAAFGEVMVTCEKAVWLLREGERWLRPESRSAGRMVRSAGSAAPPDGLLLRRAHGRAGCCSSPRLCPLTPKTAQAR